jgi:two-component system, sensor histidine kinase and response regulator
MGNFSKIEAGKFDLGYCAFDLRTVVEEALEVVAPLAHRKQLELCAPLDDSVPAGVVGDPFTAQADSAERAQQCGQVYGDRRSRPQREPRGNWNGRTVLRFEIRDTGIGISPKAQARLFRSFSQADTSTTRCFGRTGLGLVICKRLIELMGGEIGLITVPGCGSTFWLTVPFQVTTETIAIPVDVGNLKDRRVLAVDDNGTNRNVLKQQLGKFGVIVTCAASGRDALEELVLADRLGRPRSVEEMFGAVPPQLQADRSSGQKKLTGRVLAAKDNLTNQKVIVMRLEKLGCTVNVACNGYEAVLAAGAMEYDLVLWPNSPGSLNYMGRVAVDRG